jgi:hypothetical protein
MNDIFEFWSLPWHALQRSLANGLKHEVAGGPAAGSMPVNVGARAPDSSWLARAQNAAPQLRQTAR